MSLAPGALATLEALSVSAVSTAAHGTKRPRTPSAPPAASPSAAATFTSAGSLAASLLSQLGQVVEKDAGNDGGSQASAHFPSMAEEAAQWGLDECLVQALSADGITHFFPIQRSVIPALLVTDASADATVCDTSISAPTGSGKTIAFSLPVIQSLLAARRASDCLGSGGAPQRRPLHALVVLPTRDLALQVYGVISRYAQAASETLKDPIRVVAAIGQASFSDEQVSIAANGDGVDILVASPGRLAEHLDATPVLAAALAGLRVLVVDEADRLLARSYQDWVRRVNHAVFGAKDPLSGKSVMHSLDKWLAPPLVQSTAPPVHSAAPACAPWTTTFSQPFRGETSRVGCVFTPTPCAASAITGPAVHLLALPSWLDDESSEVNLDGRAPQMPSMLPTHFRRIVCSATMTANPQKLAALGLRFPKHFTVAADSSPQLPANEDPSLDRSEGKRLYSLPRSVHHAMVVCAAEEKPIALVALLRALECNKRSGLRALVFTNSVETAHRLTRLLHLLGGFAGRIVEFTASLSQTARSAVLEAAASGAISVIIASDAAARGLDLVALPAVIHYDAPSRVKTYVHRVGRTARAGAVGVSYAIVRPEQARHFRILASRTRGAASSASDTSGLRVETLPHSTIDEAMPRLSIALEKLKSVLESEQSGELQSLTAVPPIDKDAHGVALDE